MDVARNDLLCSYSRHCASDCSCCDFEACDCHAVCPSDCSCSHDAPWSRHIVRCPRANLSSVHPLLPQTVTELDYQGNEIEEIQPFVFIGKTSLMKLDLVNNKLRRLANDSFCAASNLRQLNLSQNPDLIVLPSMIDQWFHCLKHLQHVILSREQIQQNESTHGQWTMHENNSNDRTVRLVRATPPPSSSGEFKPAHHSYPRSPIRCLSSSTLDQYSPRCDHVFHQSCDTSISNTTGHSRLCPSARMYHVSPIDHSSCHAAFTLHSTQSDSDRYRLLPAPVRYTLSHATRDAGNVPPQTSPSFGR